MKYPFLGNLYEMNEAEVTTFERFKRDMETCPLTNRNGLLAVISRFLDKQSIEYYHSPVREKELLSSQEKAKRRAELEEKRCERVIEWAKKIGNLRPGMRLKIKGTRDGRDRFFKGWMNDHTIICTKMKSPFEVTTHGVDKIIGHYPYKKQDLLVKI